MSFVFYKAFSLQFKIVTIPIFLTVSYLCISLIQCYSGKLLARYRTPTPQYKNPQPVMVAGLYEMLLLISQQSST